MTTPTKFGTALRRFVALANSAGPAGTTDRELMQRFLADRDERAFAALLTRHGPMVLGVASRVLRSHSDAEDVFQAAFLLLARKMSSIRKAGSLGCWLHGVAYHLALRLRAQQLHRSRREQEAAAMRATQTTVATKSPDLESTLDQALNEMPEIYRQAIILCHLEGCDHAKAARTLGCSLNTLRSRLVRGRKRLRLVLEQRGATHSDGLLTLGLTAIVADTAQSASLMHETLASCLQFATGASADAVARGSVAALVRTGLRSLLLSKTLIGTLLFLGFGLGLGLLTAVAGWQPGQDSATEPRVRQVISDSSAKVAKTKPLTDRFGDPLPEGAIQRLGTIRFRHGGKIESVAYSPDGKQIVTGGADAKVKIWDRATGKELITFDGHSDDVHFVTFTPDGKYVISSSGGMSGGNNQKDPCTLKWEASTGKVALRFPGNKWNREMAALALSPDGKKLAGCLTPELYIFDVETGQFLHTFPIEDSLVYKIQFSPDGRKLAMLNSGEGVSLLEVTTGRRIWLNNTLKGDLSTFEPAAGGIAFSQDGQWLAARVAPNRDNRLTGPVRVLEMKNGKEKSSFDEPGFGPIRFSPDGKEVLTINGIWNAASGKKVKDLPGGGSRVFESALSPDAKELALAQGISLIRIDAQTAKVLAELGAGHGTTTQLVISSDSRSVAAASYFDPEASIRIWDLETCDPKAILPGDYYPIAFAPDLAGLAYGEYRRLGYVFRKSIDSWAAIEPDLQGTGTQIKSLAYTSDGKKLVGTAAEVGGRILDGGPVFVWDLPQSNKAIKIGSLPPGGGARCAAMSSDNHVFATGCWDSVIRLWDINTKQAGPTLSGQKATFVSLGISPNGMFITGASGATGNRSTVGLSTRGSDRHLRIWNIQTGKVQQTIEGPAEGTWSVAWSPDGKYLASGGDDAVIRIWEMMSGKECMNFKGHGGPVTSLAFTPDGKRLLSGSTDTTILVWDMAKVGRASGQIQR